MKISPYESHRGRPKWLLKEGFLRKGGDMRKVTIIVLAIAFLAGSVSVFAADRTYPGPTSPQSASCMEPTFVRAGIGPENLWAPNNKPVNVTVRGVVRTSYPCVITGAWYVVDGGEDGAKRGRMTVNRDGTFTADIEVMASRSGKDKDGKVPST
jgi:hypothetical protein